jgi:hypothetical protein
MNWSAIILAAVSAYYFGWVKGQDDGIKGIKPGEIVIDGKKIVLPQSVYQIIKGTVNVGTTTLPQPTKVNPYGS